jgi:hypothetical protein
MADVMWRGTPRGHGPPALHQQPADHDDHDGRGGDAHPHQDLGAAVLGRVAVPFAGHLGVGAQLADPGVRGPGLLQAVDRIDRVGVLAGVVRVEGVPVEPVTRAQFHGEAVASEQVGECADRDDQFPDLRALLMPSTRISLWIGDPAVLPSTVNTERTMSSQPSKGMSGRFEAASSAAARKNTSRTAMSFASTQWPTVAR